MTGIELACWLIVNADDRPITLEVPAYAAGSIPVEATAARLETRAYLPVDALVGRGEVVVICADDADAGA